MDASHSQPLATESFSYSWLTDRTLHRRHGGADGTSTPRDQNFDFHLSFSPASPSTLVHADEIFSDGHIMPLYVGRSTTTSVPPSPPTLTPIGSYIDDNYRSLFLRKWRKRSKMILRRCLGFVLQTLSGPRKSSRVDDLERKVCEVEQNRNCSPPRLSSAYSVVDWSDIKKIGAKVNFYYGIRKVKSWSNLPQAEPSHHLTPSCNSNSSDAFESSIHEAILYCKRSIEK
ncbi:uncharacterized protein LOC127263016 [Andrographis paniculata]|uniref:uncharacterized protein LOC127263016 n=1 Tax=Andrographis paniculata TaxID=175694 RepID=UPI0021E8BBA4|nr:uncharacterized protein LOC127263016 [Andrographis paniculata]